MNNLLWGGIVFEYEFIRGVNSRYGLEWEFKGHIYQQKGFIDVLNILGEDGWQMTVKTSNFKYILMREKDTSQFDKNTQIRKDN